MFNDLNTLNHNLLNKKRRKGDELTYNILLPYMIQFPEQSPRLQNHLSRLPWLLASKNLIRIVAHLIDNKTLTALKPVDNM